MNSLLKTPRILALCGFYALCAQAENFSIHLGDVISPGVPGPGAGNIESITSDDTYTFEATAGQLIFADVISVATAFEGYLIWELKSPSGASVFRAYFDMSDDGRKTLPETGTYTLRLWVTGTSATRIGNYSFALRPIAPDQTFPIQIGDTVSNSVPAPGAGNIESAGAQDFYTFQATAGQSAFFEQISAAAAFNGNLQLELNGPDGQMVFRSYFGNTAGRHLLEKTGTYTVRIYSTQADAAQAGTYSFRLREIPPDPTFAISIGQTVSDGTPGTGAGKIEVPGAQDFYTFQGTAGQVVFFDELSAAAAFQGYLTWETKTPSGASLFRDYLDASSDTGRKTLPETGTYTICVYVGGPPNVSRVGAYSFNTYAIGDTTFPITVGSVVTNGIPGPGAGKIDVAGEQDVFTFSGTTGRKVTFVPLSVASSFKGQLFWEIKAPSGTQIVRDYFDKGRDHTAVLPESGNYSIRLSSQISTADRIGEYSFRLYSPVVANPDQFVTSPGKALVIPVQKFLCNDTSEQGDALSVSVSDVVSQAGMPLLADATQITYTPSTGFSGVDGFRYRLAGVFGGESLGSVTIVVAPGAGDHPSVVSFKRAGASMIQVCLFGDPNKIYNVETSTDLANWQPTGTVTADGQGSIDYQFDTGSEPSRYYRFR